MNPVLVLTSVRPERRTSERIRPATIDCTAFQAQLAAATNDFKTNLFEHCFERAVVTTLIVKGRPIGHLAERIGTQLGRLVIDDTGLAGLVDVSVEWEFDRDAARRNAMMLVAVEEQLGLKLETRRAPMPVVVIDSIERPSPD